MRIKSILLSLVCFLLSGLTVPVIACLPGDCDDCETWNTETKMCDPDCTTGQCCQNDDCVDTCSGCYKCLDGSCEPCKCWDDGNPISGSITVQNAKLCEQKTHTSSISDTDHWFKGGNGGEGCEGSPSDTISTYSWSKTADTNPETGTFTGATDESTVNWKAPPCTGTVIIKLDADDEPDSMDNPCPDSDRDDPNKVFQGTSTVSLPEGCTTGTKSANLQSQIVGTPSCPSGTCGATEITGLFANIEARYNGCKWIFQVSALADVLSGACPSNYCNIENGNEPCINEYIYCGIVYRFIYTNGCVSLGDFIPSSTPCVQIHEAKHYEIFEREFGNKESWLLEQASMSDMTIDCSDPTTTTCQAAVTSRRSAIEGDIEKAFRDAWGVAANDEIPMAAAYLCFYFTADAICQYALYNGWGDCSYCPEWP